MEKGRNSIQKTLERQKLVSSKENAVHTFSIIRYKQGIWYQVACLYCQIHEQTLWKNFVFWHQTQQCSGDTPELVLRVDSWQCSGRGMVHCTMISCMQSMFSSLCNHLSGTMREKLLICMWLYAEAVIFCAWNNYKRNKFLSIAKMKWWVALDLEMEQLIIVVFLHFLKSFKSCQWQMFNCYVLSFSSVHAWI